MCKGAEEGKHGSFCTSFKAEEVASNSRARGSVSCELCGLKASLYCQADDAYLCRKCDRWVHEANFLALRHMRCFLCKTCQNLTQRYLVGDSAEVYLPTILSWVAGSQHNSGASRKCSRMQKSHFFFR
ncbi:hypothetical protein L6164_022245 [Bauhinia variegata]|uniref:Uncharacterized protein n=1 Tax=Bauhinia variegata TaxID=167791 RepID=A0ACB9MHY1_BAUVA|nr:hypothetical protein L6164_022245 [Bauhinia variegata]